MILAEILEHIKSVAPSRMPDNPSAELPSGYKYRALPLAAYAKVCGRDEVTTVLACALASEAPPISTYPQYAYAIGEAIGNASVHGVGYQCCHDPRFSEFTLGQQSGRWCSTYQRPTAQHFACAELLVSRSGDNLLARGATQWIDMKSQIFMNSKKPETNPTPEVMMERRYKQGQKWVGRDALIDPFVLTLFGKNGVPLSEAMNMLAEGRRR